MKVLTYNEWCSQQLNRGGSFKCQACEGEGEVECGCCGHENECDECEGTGYKEVSKYAADSIEKHDYDKYFDKRDYAREIVDLCLKLHLWTRKDLPKLAKQMGIELLEEGRFRLDIQGEYRIGDLDPNNLLNPSKNIESA
jgi:hypothetical protein